jgi:hypothetical protein
LIFVSALSGATSVHASAMPKAIPFIAISLFVPAIPRYSEHIG